MALMNPVTHTASELFDIFNGSHDFIMTPNKTAPGGYNCVQKYAAGQAQNTTMPWSMVGIDPAATKSATESLDGFDGVEVWSQTKPMPGPPGAPNETKIVHVAPTAAPGLDKPMVLRTSFIHEVRRMGQDKYWANGIREFSLNFKQGLPDHKFDPFVAVPGVVCHWPKNAWVDADDCAPPCKSGRCCKDPNDPAAKGACFGVDVCQQLPGPGALFEGVAPW